MPESHPCFRLLMSCCLSMQLCLNVFVSFMYLCTCDLVEQMEGNTVKDNERLLLIYYFMICIVSLSGHYNNDLLYFTLNENLK